MCTRAPALQRPPPLARAPCDQFGQCRRFRTLRTFPSRRYIRAPPSKKHQKASIRAHGLLHARWRSLAVRAERPRNGSMSEKSCPEGLPWVSVDDAKGFRALNPTTSLFCRWAASRCLPRCWFAIRDHRWRSLTQQHLRICPDRH